MKIIKLRKTMGYLCTYLDTYFLLFRVFNPFNLLDINRVVNVIS